MKIASFGVVGVLAAGVDFVAFNALRIPFGAPWAKAMSMMIAALVAFIGNRQHTFRDHSGGGPLGKQLGTYLGLNLVGLGISEACLLVSERGLGLHGVVADNISVNGVGFLIATAFRFWSYQRWVFGAPVVAVEAT